MEGTRTGRTFLMIVALPNESVQISAPVQQCLKLASVARQAACQMGDHLALKIRVGPDGSLFAEGLQECSSCILPGIMIGLTEIAPVYQTSVVSKDVL